MTEHHRKLAAMMTERDLQAAIVQICDELRIWHFAVRDSRGCPPGWPDLTLIGRRIVFRELKSENGRTSTDQLGVGSLIRAAGGDWAVWRPADLNSGHIARFLYELARR